MISLLVTVLTAGSAPWWWPKVHHWYDQATGHQISGMSGGCGGYQLYAQNRYDPVGTSVRSAPDPLATKVAGIAPNEIIAVNGWVHAKVAYPTNHEPWNSDIWFHLSDNRGWVSFAGVRAAPTEHDPTGRAADGGIPATTPQSCQATLS